MGAKSEEIVHDEVREGTHQGCAGNGYDPGHDHLACDIPVDCLDALSRATPMMEPETTCVVETGRCSSVAEKMNSKELGSAENP